MNAVVIDPQSAEILEFTGPTVPLAAFRELEFTVSELEEKLECERRDKVSAHRRASAKQRELDDLLEQAADRETVLKVLGYWVKKTGRDPQRTKLPLSGERARVVRWLLRSWTEREVCIMVVGLMADAWHVQHGKTDLVHIAERKGKWSESKATEFLEAGYRALGQTPPPVEAEA